MTLSPDQFAMMQRQLGAIQTGAQSNGFLRLLGDATAFLRGIRPATSPSPTPTSSPTPPVSGSVPTTTLPAGGGGIRNAWQPQVRQPEPWFWPTSMRSAPPQFGPGLNRDGPMPAFVPTAQWQGGQMPYSYPEQPMINPHGLGAFAMGGNIGTVPQPNPKVLPSQIPTTTTTTTPTRTVGAEYTRRLTND